VLKIKIKERIVQKLLDEWELWVRNGVSFRTWRIRIAKSLLFKKKLQIKDLWRIYFQWILPVWKMMSVLSLQLKLQVQRHALH